MDGTRSLAARAWRRYWGACHGHALPPARPAAIGNGTHHDLETWIVFVHRPRRRIDAESNQATEQHIPRRHRFGMRGERSDAGAEALCRAGDSNVVLAFRQYDVARGWTVRVPMAGDCSWHVAPGTPGIFTETCCSVPLTMVEQPANRTEAVPHKAAVARTIGLTPQPSFPRK